jgi:hypothetical protein
MIQLLFGLTVVFVMYVIYEVFKTVSQTESTPPPVPQPAQEETVAPADTPAKAEAEPAASHEDESDRHIQLRNPATGEISPVPTNYRFAKKWIKEALVAENLLDRVYKPNELDEAHSQKVKEALDQFRTLAKYRA